MEQIQGRVLLRNQLYLFLKEQITQGLLKPGILIDTKKIAQDLKVSKTPLSEAFIQLQGEGFITIYPQKGVMINIITRKDIKEIYEILGGLDSRVMLSAFAKIKKKHIDIMVEVNERMIKCNSFEDSLNYYNLNVKFHEVYLKLHDNERIINLVTNQRKVLFDFSKRFYGKDWERDNYEEHMRIIELIKSGNAKETAEYIRDVHLTLKDKYAL